MECGSRRKQLRPARVDDDEQLQQLQQQQQQIATSTVRQSATVSSDSAMGSVSNGRRSPPGTSSASETPMFINNVKFEVEDEEAPSGIELMSGETRGPFPVKELRASNSEAENSITLIDQSGNKHYFDVDSIDPLIKRIKPCPKPLEANCIIFHVESLIQILITRDVHYNDDLAAIFLPQQQPSTASEDTTEKRYPCSKCHIAKFNNIDNLNAHQKFYCKGNQRVAIGLPPTLVPSINHEPVAIAQPQNVILVPIAYHEHQHEMVQLLGPPQTIVPVAIGRPAAGQNGMPQLAVPLTDPLMVHRGLLGVVRTPSKIQFAVGDLAVTIPIVPIEMRGVAGLKRTIERPISTPLDLSKRRRDSCSSGSTTPTTAVRATLSDVEKPFLCACGISFSADETLKAHRQYYCKLVEREEDNKEPPKKVKTRCNHCDFEPGSLSQLSVHVRTMHSDVQAYVCRLCGYRGFSLRGIRCHMRTHPEFDSMKFEFLLANHIAKVKTERRTPENQENMDQD
ncbi:hypothetical protein Q1695_009634 [Nippostrongylus brasiliensis]|nr:hypothetical protein Q1695_009634 [Nippostrongylus brasiliensis]